MDDDIMKRAEKRAIRRFWVSTFWVLWPAVMVGFFSYQIGKDVGEHDQRRKSQCRCGQTRTCAFGFGIVGEQSCVEDQWDGNRWARCEPKPLQP
jgi:hypothetical protein